jgi:tripartite-type tricarboxylate transporter receptor subunit TctC
MCTVTGRVRSGIAFAWLTLAFMMPGAAGQSYPAKPVRIIAPDAGSGNDYVLRLMTPGLSNLWGSR